MRPLLQTEWHGLSVSRGHDRRLNRSRCRLRSVIYKFYFAKMAARYKKILNTKYTKSTSYTQTIKIQCYDPETRMHSNSFIQGLDLGLKTLAPMPRSGVFSKTLTTTLRWVWECPADSQTGPKEPCIKWLHIGDIWQILRIDLCGDAMRRVAVVTVGTYLTFHIPSGLTAPTCGVLWLSAGLLARDFALLTHSRYNVSSCIHINAFVCSS